MPVRRHYLPHWGYTNTSPPPVPNTHQRHTPYGQLGGDHHRPPQHPNFTARKRNTYRCLQGRQRAGFYHNSTAHGATLEERCTGTCLTLRSPTHPHKKWMHTPCRPPAGAPCIQNTENASLQCDARWLHAQTPTCAHAAHRLANAPCAPFSPPFTPSPPPPCCPPPSPPPRPTPQGHTGLLVGAMYAGWGRAQARGWTVKHSTTRPTKPPHENRGTVRCTRPSSRPTPSLALTRLPHNHMGAGGPNGGCLGAYRGVQSHLSMVAAPFGPTALRRGGRLGAPGWWVGSCQTAAPACSALLSTAHQSLLGRAPRCQGPPDMPAVMSTVWRRCSRGGLVRRVRGVASRPTCLWRRDGATTHNPPPWSCWVPVKRAGAGHTRLVPHRAPLWGAHYHLWLLKARQNQRLEGKGFWGRSSACGGRSEAGLQEQAANHVPYPRASFPGWALTPSPENREQTVNKLRFRPGFPGVVGN